MLTQKLCFLQVVSLLLCLDSIILWIWHINFRKRPMEMEIMCSWNFYLVVKVKIQWRIFLSYLVLAVHLLWQVGKRERERLIHINRHRNLPSLPQNFQTSNSLFTILTLFNNNAFDDTSIHRKFFIECAVSLKSMGMSGG